MKKKSAVLVLLLSIVGSVFLQGCNDNEGFTVTVEYPLTRPKYKDATYRMWVFSVISTNDAASCQNLMSGIHKTGDDGYFIEDQAALFAPFANNVSSLDVSKNDARTRLFYVEGENASGDLIIRGCTEVDPHDKQTNIIVSLEPSCPWGKGNCDDTLSNGCESDLTSATDCGACDNTCTNDHGSTGCTSGACVPTCDPGFGDCDGNSRNGCEADFSSPNTCSGHAIGCSFSGGNTICACSATYRGDNCDQCIVGYTGYPNCDLAAGTVQSNTVAGVSFNMNYVPAGTFPTGVNNMGSFTVNEGFWFGETEVTYELWNAVYTWATSHDYAFANPGRQGGDSGTGPLGTNQHPVSTISWRDAMVWCNAASELAGLAPVYKYQSVAVKDSRDTNATACDDVTDDETADGYRLPGSMQWECAARYIGETDPGWGILNAGIYWTPGNYASGATADFLDGPATLAVAVFREYRSGSSWVATGVTSTAAVKSKGDTGKNALGLYDMSGNVWEFCSDLVSRRIYRGGCYDNQCTGLQIGLQVDNPPSYSNSTLGLRLMRKK